MNAPTSVAALAPTVKLLIGGKFVESKTTEWRDVVNPATQEVLARVPFATADEIDAAIASGNHTWNGMSAAFTPSPPMQRMKISVSSSRGIPVRSGGAVNSIVPTSDFSQTMPARKAALPASV